MNVESVMTKSPRTCLRTDMLHTAAQVMWEGDCGIVPVVDEASVLVGVVTDRDVCMAAYTSGAPLFAIPVERAMAAVVTSIHADARVEQAAELMTKVQVRRLPVVDDDGKLVGLVSVADLVQRAFGTDVAKSKRVKAAVVAKALESVSRPRPAVDAAADKGLLVPARGKRVAKPVATKAAPAKAAVAKPMPAKSSAAKRAPAKSGKRSR